MKKAVHSIYVQLFLFFIVLNSCYFPVENSDNTPAFGMYFLYDSELSYTDVKRLSIEHLALEKSAFLTASDIKSFTVNYIDNNPIQSYHVELRDRSVRFSDKVRPFVLVLNGKRFLLGEHWPAPMSIIPKSVIFYPMVDFFELMPGDERGNNLLKDPQILTVLQESGVEIIYRDLSMPAP